MKRPYTYYDWTQSLCEQCLNLISAKIVFQDDQVLMLKHCPKHGHSSAVISTDIDYYLRCRTYLKPGDVPKKFNTPVKYGCPYDCGLCTDHEQHSCLSVVEITDRCNLKCPTCYSESSPSFGRHRTVEEVNRMLDVVVENEGEPDIIQISGGEPTIHPNFFEILDLAKSKPIRHLMLNTNGVRIAKDLDFVKRLSEYKTGFEIYLQFDSFNPDVLKSMRGEDLTNIREKAIQNLNEFNISTTLVVTLQKQQNMNEIGKVIDYALKQRSVRGVTFQPVQLAGRLEDVDPIKDRVTLSEVREQILEQSPLFEAGDLIPVPCNPDALAMGYALKLEEGVFPLSRYIDPQQLLDDPENTIVYEQNQGLRSKMVELFSTGLDDKGKEHHLQSLLCCLPKIKAPNISYDQVFRVVIMQFMDAYNFDVRAVKRSCVHIVSKEGKIIPFENMNLLYRNDKINRLDEIRKQRGLI